MIQEITVEEHWADLKKGKFYVQFQLEWNRDKPYPKHLHRIPNDQKVFSFAIQDELYGYIYTSDQSYLGLDWAIKAIRRKVRELLETGITGDCGVDHEQNMSSC